MWPCQKEPGTLICLLMWSISFFCSLNWSMLSCCCYFLALLGDIPLQVDVTVFIWRRVTVWRATVKFWFFKQLSSFDFFNCQVLIFWRSSTRDLSSWSSSTDSELLFRRTKLNFAGVQRDYFIIMITEVPVRSYGPIYSCLLNLIMTCLGQDHPTFSYH